MGDQRVQASNNHVRRDFIKHLLDDIEALEIMLKTGMIEDDITRIGAEQEFCLVSDNWRPEKNAEQILDEINDEHFTTELAKYNLEINLDPVELNENAFDKVQQQLEKLLSKASDIARQKNTRILLTGILPTISKTELELPFMTPRPRYEALNNMMKGARGTDFQLHIRGIDELTVTHDSVLFEACNTSFQMHLQVAPQDFIASYNWAQAISGPILAVSSNSPLLLGRELWSETRIALFQQSIDTRMSTYALKDQQPRVMFGDEWAEKSIANIYKNDIANHKVLLAREIENNALETLKNGQIPKLEALATHTGSIYRWNRPCYGTGGGKPHIRIENRYIAAGPTVLDEMANFAFWVGLMIGRPEKFDDMSRVMDFKDAKSNFVKAARTGKASILTWNNDLISARDLVTDELLPIAYFGLEKAGIHKKTADKLLTIIDKRAQRQTGAQWCIRNYRKLRQTVKTDDALLAITKATYDNQSTSRPVHEWPMIQEIPKTHEVASLVGHVMTTRIFTVHPNDLAELATKIMEWRDINHMPVENDNKMLCGLLTSKHMKKFSSESHKDSTVADIMVKDVLAAPSDMPIKEAIVLMKEHEIGCLPILNNHHLVGIVTIKDLIAFDND